MGGAPRVLILVLTVLMGAGGAGCGLLRGKPKACDDGFVEDMRRGRRPMGQVTMVDGEGRFALVRSPLAASTPVDSTLVVKAQGTATTTGQLKVTPERKRNLIAADIMEGAPKVGEVVFFQTQEKVVSTAPPPAEPGVAAASGGSGAVATAGAGGGGGPVFPEGVAPTGAGGGAGSDLPPLGEPSGPREVIPDFPGLDPGSAAGGAPGPLPEPATPDA